MGPVVPWVHPQHEHHHPNRPHILKISNSVTLYLVIDHEGVDHAIYRL